MIRLLPVIISVFYLLYFIARALSGKRPTTIELFALFVALIIAGSTVYYIFTTN